MGPLLVQPNPLHSAGSGKPSAAATQAITYHGFKVGPAPRLSSCPPALRFFGLGSWAPFGLLPGAHFYSGTWSQEDHPAFSASLFGCKVYRTHLPRLGSLRGHFPSLTSFQAYSSAWDSRCTVWAHMLQPCPGTGRQENMQPGLLPDPVKLFLLFRPSDGLWMPPTAEPTGNRRAGSLMQAGSADQAPRPCREWVWRNSQNTRMCLS